MIKYLPIVVMYALCKSQNHIKRQTFSLHFITIQEHLFWKTTRNSTHLSKKMKKKMKNTPLLIFLILALAFVHEANAGKIVGTLESADGPMDAANEPMDEADGLIYAANRTMDRELVASSKYSKTSQFAIFGTRNFL